MGSVSFTELFHLLLTGTEPTDDQRDFLDPTRGRRQTTKLLK
jgi:hypothetical protein